jgi:shikimate kinase
VVRFVRREPGDTGRWSRHRNDGAPVIDHVVLVGLMGAGKTTIGRRLAEELGRPFVDCDAELEARAGRTVAEVFANDGEPGFRRLEADVLADLLDHAHPAVIAAGGGAVVTERTRDRLRDGAFVVWLDADPAFLGARIDTKPTRPLLQGDPVEVLQRLHREREAWYREVATEVVDVAAFHDGSPKPKRRIARAVAARVRAHERDSAIS